MLKSNNSLQPGFNFIELLISITIMALFIGLVGPRFMSLLGRSRKTATESALKTVATGIKQYKIDIGSYPNSLEDLVKKPENVSNWQGPYVGDEDKGTVEIPVDGWGNEIQYTLNSKGSVPPFDLYSHGDPTKEDDRISYAK